MTREKIMGLVAIAGVLVYSIAARLLAFSQPYHQDEYKWALAAEPRWGLEGSIPHPELARLVYEYTGFVVGYSHLRVVPILITACIALLLFLYVRRSFGILAAFLTLGVFLIDFYALLGSVQIDIDGAFLPLFTLLSFMGYLWWRDSAESSFRRRGVLMAAAGLVLGFVAKLSFVLTPAAIALDLFFSRADFRRLLFSRRVVLSVIAAAVFAGSILAVFWNDVWFLRYVDNFVALHGRDYAQLAFLTVKGLFYLSPVIVFGMVLGLRYARELSIWYIFLALNILFYFVIFDFTHRTFDRYLLFFTLPGAVITGVALARAFVGIADKKRLLALTILCTAVAGIVTHLVFSMPHTAIPLIPKTAFIDAVTHGIFSILLPLTGGSGPLGFYVPLDALLILWAVAAAATLYLLFAFRSSAAALAIFLGVSLTYNVFMTVEYLTGTYYGSAPKVVHELIARLDASGNHEPLLTYNDTAAYELHTRGLYGGRFYPHPQFIPDNVKKFDSASGYFLVVNMPAIDPISGYGRFFAACKSLEEVHSGVIGGQILDCRVVNPEMIAQ